MCVAIVGGLLVPLLDDFYVPVGLANVFLLVG